MTTNSLARLMRRGRSLWRRDAIERTLDSEMQYHLECSTREHLAAGMSPIAARERALREFGGVERFKEAARDARGTRIVEDLARDVRYARRVLQKNWTHSLAVIVTLTVSVAAMTAVFSVVYGVLLRPLPYTEPDRLVSLRERNVARNRDNNVVSVTNFEAWRERTRSYVAMVALVPRPSTLSGLGAPERIPGVEVSPEYFRMLGLQPQLGRGFESGDARVVVISHRLWQRRYSADPAAIGRALVIADVPYTIVGVMPASFEPPRFGWLGEQDIWFPFEPTAQNRVWGRSLLVIARLAPGVELKAARAELGGIASQLEQEKAENRGWSASIVPLDEQVAGHVRAPLLAVLGTAALLFTLAFTNVGMLVAAFVARRQQEIVMRRALGASNRRLLGQLLVQNAMLGVAGVTFGIAASVPAVGVLRQALPTSLPRLGSVAVDTPVSITISAVSIAAVFVLTVIVARFASPRTDGARLSISARVTQPATAGLLVVAEVGLSLAIGVTALLAARSLSALQAVDIGFEADKAIVARIALPETLVAREQGRAFFELLLERVRLTAGVESAALISTRPFGGAAVATTVRDARRVAPAAADAVVADVRYADAGIFRTLGVPVIAHTDLAASVPSAVISESLAQAVWAQRAALGQRLHLSLFGGIEATVATVVRDAHLHDSRTAPRPTVYLPIAQLPSSAADLVVRVTADPRQVVPALRAAVAELHASAPIYQIEQLEGLVATSQATERAAAYILAVFAAIALTLAGMGVFGVFAGDAAARRREIGIRLALGDTGSGIVVRFLRHATVQAAAGVAVGTVLALGMSRALSPLLFGVSPHDPGSFAIAGVLIIVVALAASALPAWRALRSSPLAVLRDA